MPWVEGVDVGGTPPPERGGHAGCAVGDSLCVFIGGANRTPTAYSDAVALECPIGGPYKWKDVACTVAKGAQLPPRSGATATAVGSKVYVIGGQDPETGIAFNDVIVLDTDTWEWSRTYPEGGSPPLRHSHCAALHDDGRMIVVFGGAGMDGPLSDVWLFDTEVVKWVRPKVQGQSPPPREMAAGVAVGGGRVLVYGGRGEAGVLADAWLLDIAEAKWTSLGHTRHPRCAAAAATVPRAAVPGVAAGSGSVVLLYGGFSGGAVEGDVLLVDPDAIAKTGVVSAAEAGPGGRFACAGVSLPSAAVTGAVAARMVVFGGVSAEADLNSVAVWEQAGKEAAAAAPDVAELD